MANYVLAYLLLVVSLWGQNSLLLILHKGGSSLGFYTPEGKMHTAVPVGQHPHEIVLSNDGRYAYTTDNGTMRIEQAGTGGNTVSIIDLEGRKKAGEISLGKFRRPHGLDIDRASGRLFVSCELPDQLLAVDPRTRSIVRAYDTKGKTAHMVALGPGAKFAYVSHSNSANVAAINLATGEVKLIATAARPEGSVLSKDGRTLYVVNREAASISLIDTAKNEVAGTIRTGQGPVRIALTPDGKQLVYALMHENKVEFADPAARKVLGQVALNGKPVSLSISRDGRYAYASGEEQDLVFVVSIADRKVVREIKTVPGMGPDPVVEMPINSLH